MTDLPTLLKAGLAERYTIERELGRGGMALVFLAHDVKHDRKVAIKVLRPELAAALGAERFLREITIAAQLHHSHILPLYDSGEAASFLYYVMPYVEGESLRDRLERETQLPLEDALQIAREVADALSYAHSRDVVHRDVKPENILLESGHAIVADFGIARAITAAGGERLTETGLAVGTPAYMSPEQGTGAPHIDGRSDIYSLGCVLYEMLAGAPPFTGPSAQAILARHSMDPLPSLRTVRSAVPEPVEQAIAKAMGKVPADRFATATQFADALVRPTVLPSRVSWLRLRWALAALVVILVGAAVWQRTRPRGSPVVPAASVIAVLPPVPVSPDTALSTLGRNLVWTLTASLNGVGELKTIDALTVLAQTLDRSDLPLDEAASLGRRLGASGVVHGTLTRDGPKVRLDLGLYDARDAAPVARAFVTASPEDLNALTDSAAWALLGQVWRSGVPPSPSLAAVTTRSLPALRAFLDGERAVTEYRWPDAAEAFGRAIQEDSTFWLAYWRYAWAKGWQGEGLDSATASVARAHLEDLPERERMFAEIWRTPAPASFDSARRLTGRFPDYWPGWLALGDELFHNGPGFGHSPEEAREAFERALALYPHLGPAWDHMAWIATFIRDTALYKRVAQEVPWVGGAGLDLMRGRPLGRPAMDSALVELLGWRDPQVQEMQAAAWLYDSPAVQMELSQRLLAAGALPMAANAHRLGLAVGWAARGAWDSAMVAIDRYAARSPDSTAALEPYQFAVLGVWLGGLSPEQAASRRTGVQAQRLPARSQPVLLWLDGLLAAVRRDSMGIRAAQRAIGPPDTSYAGCFARSLAAFDLALRGRRREAGESLAAMAWVSQWASGGDAGRGAIFRGVNRMAAARWLAAEGDTDQARRLLLWRYGLPGPYARYWLEIHVLNSLTSLEAARIEAARGNVAKARHYYEDFLRTYDRPVPALAHVVTEAREALGRLEGKAIGEGRPRP